MAASSTGRRNTGAKSLCWGFVFQGLPWPFVELTGGPVQLSLRVHRQVGSFREVLPQQPLVFSFKPRCQGALWMAEVDIDIGATHTEWRQGRAAGPSVVGGNGDVRNNAGGLSEYIRPQKVIPAFGHSNVSGSQACQRLWRCVSQSRREAPRRTNRVYANVSNPGAISQQGASRRGRTSFDCQLSSGVETARG